MAEVLGIAGSIAGLIQLTGWVANAAYSYFGSIKDARKDIEGLWNELKALEKVLRELEKSPSYSQSNARSTLDEPFQRCFLELDELQLKLKPRKRTLNWIHRCKWPLQEKETGVVIARIERHKSLFTLALTTDQHNLLRAVEAFTYNTDMAVGDLIKSLTKEFADLKRQRQEEAASRAGERRTKVLNWLYPHLVDERHLEIRGRRQKHTGKWLTNDAQFQEWLEGHSKARLMWGHGIPGAGKTFLSSLIIDELVERASTTGFGVAYIYFNFKEQEQQTPINVLRSLIKQLMTQLPELDVPDGVGALYDQFIRRDTRPIFEELVKALEETCNLFPRVFFVFDALDECLEKTQRKDLLPFFHDLAKNGASLFLTSRPYPRDIHDSLDGTVATKIELEAKEADITIYVEETISGNSHANALIRGGLREKVISKLVGCCNGMFLLVHFHIEDLCQYTSIKQVDRALEGLNATLRTDSPLDGIYNRAMENIQRQHASRAVLAYKVLSWLVKARRVLTLAELRMAVSIEQTDKDPPSEGDMPDDAMLVEVCGGLAIIDQNSNTVRLAHYSVQEYLMGSALITQKADLMIVVTCITVLSFTSFAKPTLDSLVAAYPLLDYVAHYFDSHLRACDEESTLETYLQFLRNRDALSLYQRARITWGTHPGPPKSYTSGIEWEDIAGDDSPFIEASWVGHRAAVSLLFGEGYSFPKVPGRKTALYVAAAEGHEPVVRLLLEEGSDIDAVRGVEWTPLFAAVARGQVATVKLLIEKGAQVSTRRAGSIPLDLALGNGFEEIATLLVRAGADNNCPDHIKRSALDITVQNRHNSTAKLLHDINRETAPQAGGGEGGAEVVGMENLTATGI